MAKRGQGESKTSPRRVTAVIRQDQAILLRRNGATYPQIATALGYRSKQAARDAVVRGLTRSPQEPADELRRLFISRWERIIYLNWAGVEDGDPVRTNIVMTAQKQLDMITGLNVPPPLPPDPLKDVPPVIRIDWTLTRPQLPDGSADVIDVTDTVVIDDAPSVPGESEI